MTGWTLTQHDRQILRDLGSRNLEIANDPVMEDRRRLWKKHAARQGERPMILAETSGVLCEMMPASRLQCHEEWARGIDVRNIMQFEDVRDDFVLEPFINCPWKTTVSDYGINVEKHRADNHGQLGSYAWDPPVKDLQTDLDRLHPRTFSVDREGTFAWQQFMDEVFGGILPTRIRGSHFWSLGLTWAAIDLVGMENLMLFMYDDPEGLHRLMQFLHDDHVVFVTWLEREGLLTLNNENDYIGSGGIGYTDELPQADYQDGDPARLKDLWVLSESQETVGVGPDLFAEFVFPYQISLAERFGLTYYGCCEPVHNRWHVIKQIPNLRRVSISPWCDQAFMAEALGNEIIFCRKPSPTLVSTENFDEEAIKADIRNTLSAARNCTVELAMKDVHTLANQPPRLGRWCDLAREVIEECWT